MHRLQRFLQLVLLRLVELAVQVHVQLHGHVSQLLLLPLLRSQVLLQCCSRQLLLLLLLLRVLLALVALSQLSPLGERERRVGQAVPRVPQLQLLLLLPFLLLVVLVVTRQHGGCQGCGGYLLLLLLLLWLRMGPQREWLWERMVRHHGQLLLLRQSRDRRLLLLRQVRDRRLLLLLLLLRLLFACNLPYFTCISHGHLHLPPICPCPGAQICYASRYMCCTTPAHGNAASFGNGCVFGSGLELAHDLLLQRGRQLRQLKGVDLRAREVLQLVQQARALHELSISLTPAISRPTGGLTPVQLLSALSLQPLVTLLLLLLLLLRTSPIFLPAFLSHLSAIIWHHGRVQLPAIFQQHWRVHLHASLKRPALSRPILLSSASLPAFQSLASLAPHIITTITLSQFNVPEPSLPRSLSIAAHKIWHTPL